MEPDSLRSQPQQLLNNLDLCIHTFAANYKFSSRELDVFRCLVQSVTSSEDIAKALGVSRNTVRNHFQSIFHKAKVSSKTELLARFISRAFTA